MSEKEEENHSNSITSTNTDTDTDIDSNILEEVRRDYEAYMNSKRATRGKRAWTYEIRREGRNGSKPFLVNFRINERHALKKPEEEREKGTAGGPQTESVNQEKTAHESRTEEGNAGNELKDCPQNRNNCDTTINSNDSNEKMKDKETSEEKKEEERFCPPPTKKFGLVT